MIDHKRLCVTHAYGPWHTHSLSENIFSRKCFKPSIFPLKFLDEIFLYFTVYDINHVQVIDIAIECGGASD